MQDDAEPGPLRELPYSLQAEQSTLGALLQDNGMLALVGDLVAPASFFAEAHRIIYAAIAELVACRKAADCVTVFEHLRSTFEAERFGGLKYLVELEGSVASARNARLYAEIVAERYVDRQLIAACDEAAKTSWDATVPLSNRLELIAAAISRVEQQRKSPVNRVPLMRLAALKEASASVRWLVKHVMPAESIGMLFGGSGTFKSFIALDCALHVAHGLPWMGRKTRQGPVLYIAAEGGAGLWNRIDAWHRARNLRWEKADLVVVPAAIDLTVDAWRVVDAAQAVGVTPAMVVVDTLSQTYSGEENAANEMASYLRELGLRFRQLWQCTVLLIHHTGHQATERPRGSSAIQANLDFLLSVFRDEKEMLATLTCAKQKDGDIFPDASFSLSVCELGHDEDNDRITSLVARHLGSSEEIQSATEAEAQAGRGGRNQRLMGLVQNGMTEKELRKVFYEALDGLDADAKKKAFYRARDVAVKLGQIEVAEGYILDLRGRK